MDRKSEEVSSALSTVFASRLQNWRVRQRIPLKRLAADLGVSISAVSAWEKGKRSPTLDHLEVISRHTGIPACQFICHFASACPLCPGR